MAKLHSTPYDKNYPLLTANPIVQNIEWERLGGIKNIRPRKPSKAESKKIENVNNLANAFGIFDGGIEIAADWIDILYDPENKFPSRLEDGLQDWKAPIVVFCHNDLWGGNIIRDGSEIQLVDFTEAWWNYRPYDIAYYFLSFKNWPTDEKQKDFIQIYSREMEEIISDRNSSRDSLKGATVEMMLSEVAQILPYVIFQTTLYDMEEDREWYEEIKNQRARLFRNYFPLWMNYPPSTNG